MPTPERFRDVDDPDQYPDDRDRPARQRDRWWNGDPQTAPDGPDEEETAMTTERWTDYAPGVEVKVDTATGEIVSVDGEPYGFDNGECEWFAACDRNADGFVRHPILGPVPTCRPCAEKLGLTLEEFS